MPLSESTQAQSHPVQPVVKYRSLRAYVVREYDEGEAALVFARTAKEAKTLGAKAIDYDEWIGLRAERREDYDYLEIGAMGPYVEQDQETLRKAGWMYDGEESCATCGLYENGMDKYRVCQWCHQCAECGCDEDCE